MRGDYTITITRENGIKLAVPVRIVRRRVASRIDWLAVAVFAFAAAVGAWGMWGRV